ncbi:MAG: hypothetical protein K0U37_09670 [Gammaproteobacteria bacterium]|nr:hypothetical protein [Gammaproteobacteria bacterium]
MALSSYQANLQKEADHKLMLQAYQAYLEAQKGQLDMKYLAMARSETDPSFHFASREDAIHFFKEQAKQNIPFLMAHMENWTSTGEYMLSLGDGQLIQGKITPELMQQVQEHRETITNDPEKDTALTDALKNQDEDAIRDLIHTCSSSIRPDPMSMRPGGM